MIRESGYIRDDQSERSAALSGDALVVSGLMEGLAAELQVHWQENKAVQERRRRFRGE